MKDYRLVINGITQAEAVEIMERFAGGDVMWTTPEGIAEIPDRVTGKLYCYPKNTEHVCAIEPIAH